jgi:hypothetical protein
VNVPVALASASGRLWAISLDDGTIEPLTADTLALAGDPSPVPNRYPDRLVTDGRTLWALSTTDLSMFTFDASSGRQFGGGIRLPSWSLDSIVLNDGILWFTDPVAGRLWWLDVSNDRARFHAIPVGMPAGPVAIGRCFAWVADAEKGTIQAVSLHELTTAGPALRIGRSVGGLVAARRALWATDPRGDAVMRLVVDGGP